MTAARRCCYWAYKIFQAVRLASGDYSALAELLAEGFTELAAEEAFYVAVEASQFVWHAGNAHFFSGRLVEELAALDRAAAASMRQARRAYELFGECDTNGDGWISMSEFTTFGAMFGETRLEYLGYCFGQLDTDRDGEFTRTRCY